jgi:hypothetical protein
VTLDGRPLDHGTIQFLPSASQGSTAAEAEIRDGAYSVPRARGLATGKYRVIISSAPAGAAPPAPVGTLPGASGPPAKDLIPPRYNAESTLTAEVQEEGPNEFSYALKN